MGEIGDWIFYAVKASGHMTSSTIKRTCEREGLVNTCPGPDSCRYSGSRCNVTSITRCYSPINEFAPILCDDPNPVKCPKLRGVWVYMDSYSGDSSCGISSGYGTGTYPSSSCGGKDKSDEFALCAKQKGST